MQSLISSLKQAGQDFEFYPTTSEIIARVVRDLREYSPHDRYHRRNARDLWASSVLDIGAGNGKVLEALRRADVGLCDFYAIEKSSILCAALPETVFVIGTAFEEQSLLSKSVDVIFSNPPYSQFVPWSVKIIREAAALVVYLVIPQRWADNPEIKAALQYRGAKAKVLGSFDFENAEDRTARAKVDLLRVDIPGGADGAFQAFFDEQFPGLCGSRETEAGTAPDESAKRAKSFETLSVGENYAEAIAGLYSAELAKIQRNYEAVASLDPDLLREFSINPAVVAKCLKKRLSDLRMDYWHELFSKLTSITDRLTSASRRSLLDTLNKNVHVDFTVSNIQAVVIWALRNANRYIDRQLIAVYENMVSSCNVTAYKSNQRTFEAKGWRYLEERDGWTHYKLERRIVCQSVGGINARPYESWNKENFNGLDERAFHFLQDLLTVANNMGFTCTTRPIELQSRAYTWQRNSAEWFMFTDREGNRHELFKARAFENGNLHLSFHQKFMLALNVEHGRLKGWLRDGAQAVEELKEPRAAQFFGCTRGLLVDSGFARLGAPEPREAVDLGEVSAPAAAAVVRSGDTPAGPEMLKIMQAFAGCVPEFRAKIAGLARVGGVEVWEVFQMWRDFSASCEAGDYSPSLSEFIPAYSHRLGGDLAALEAVERGELGLAA